MQTIYIRQMELGKGMPKICVPIVERSREEILAQAKKIKETSADLVEWRMDCYEQVDSLQEVLQTAGSLRQVLGDMPLLASFRSKQEGGKRSLCSKDYEVLNIAVVKSGYIDAVDVELYSEEECVMAIVEAAHKASVKVIMSNHDFEKTPAYEEILARLCLMQKKGADISKIALMPQSKKDVLTLLQASSDMMELYADRPFIAISMASDGVISRLCGELFGSCLTFGSVEKASAPGQMEAETLRRMLEALHDSL